MKLKKNYYEDIQSLPTQGSNVALAACLGLLILLPFWVKSYYLILVSQMGVYAMVCLGLNLLVGNTGQISLGHAGFVAIGGYATVLLMTKLGLPFVLALFFAGLIAAAFGALLGIPALRLEGPYLAIATLGFGLAVVLIIGRVKYFGGQNGLPVPELALGLKGEAYDIARYAIIMLATLLLTWMTHNLLKSRIGRAFQAIRDSDVAASAIGINLARYKTFAFALSAWYAGIAGGLWVLLSGSINPLNYTVLLSVQFLAMIILGGIGTLPGSILGAVVFTWLELQLGNAKDMPVVGAALTWLSEHVFSLGGLSYFTWVLTGLFLILIILFEPLGLYGIWLRIKRYWQSFPF